MTPETEEWIQRKIGEAKRAAFNAGLESARVLAEQYIEEEPRGALTEFRAEIDRARKKEKENA